MERTCRGVKTVDVRVIELVVRPLLRGGIEERADIDTRLGDLPSFGPSLSRGKDLLLILIIEWNRLIE